MKDPVHTVELLKYFESQVNGQEVALLRIMHCIMYILYIPRLKWILLWIIIFDNQ